MIMTTTDEIAGWKIVETKGLVMGLTVRSRGIAGNFMAGMRTVLGGEVTEYTAMVEDARREALDRMTQNAALMRANGVIRVMFDSSEVGASMTEIVAYGTMVVIEKL